MKAILVGYGEVGRGVFGALAQHHLVHVEDPKYGLQADSEMYYDVLLIAIPYSDEFIDIVQKFEQRFIPDVTIIFSSVPIGTCRKLGAIHSPIEGHHDNMVESIRSHKRWVGGWSNVAKIFFESAGLAVRMVTNPEATEFMKLQSTTIYGINIEWSRYCKSMADKLGFDFEDLKLYNIDYNQLVIDIHKKPNYIRYNLEPPEGKIGGHCVLPNAKLLRMAGNSHPFIQTLLDFNEEK